MIDFHADYAPSSMYLTVNCPGWRKQASLLPPEPETESSREGDAAHEVAAMMAASGVIDVSPGKTASNGVEITEEMIDGARVWVEALEGYPARIETPVFMRRLHRSKCWGTPDARQWAPETRTLRVADYKFGHGFVDEFENWQLLAYMVGLADELDLFDDSTVTFEMTVVQPRCYGAAPIRTWKIGSAGLKHYAERMRFAISQAEGESPPLKSGTHCVYCPARSACPTLGKTVMAAVDFAGRADPMVSEPAQVGRELLLVQEFIKRLESRETGLAAVAEAMIKGGQRVPGYTLEQKVGRLAWDVPPEVVEMTAQLVGKTIMKTEPITPTQARDRKILDAAVISAYASRPNGAFKLARSSETTARKFAK